MRNPAELLRDLFVLKHVNTALSTSERVPGEIKAVKIEKSARYLEKCDRRMKLAGIDFKYSSR